MDNLVLFSVGIGIGFVITYLIRYCHVIVIEKAENNGREQVVLK